jgi:hypothetical protein
VRGPTWDVEAQAVRYREFADQWRPADWPAAEAEGAFHAGSAPVNEVARALAAEILDVVPSDAGTIDALPGGEA